MASLPRTIEQFLERNCIDASAVDLFRKRLDVAVRAFYTPYGGLAAVMDRPSPVTGETPVINTRQVQHGISECIKVQVLNDPFVRAILQTSKTDDQYAHELRPCWKREMKRLVQVHPPVSLAFPASFHHLYHSQPRHNGVDCLHNAFLDAGIDLGSDAEELVTSGLVPDDVTIFFREPETNRTRSFVTNLSTLCACAADSSVQCNLDVEAFIYGYVPILFPGTPEHPAMYSLHALTPTGTFMQLYDPFEVFQAQLDQFIRGARWISLFLLHDDEWSGETCKTVWKGKITNEWP